MGEAELYAGRRREADDVTNLNQINSQRQLLRVFGGLNEGYACSEAELSEEKNFSSRGYPALETRKPRRKVREAAGMNGMYHLNGLLTVEGTTLRYAPDDGSAAVELKGALSDNEKRLVGMGTKVLIWPDKMSFDTASGTLSALGSSWQQGGVSKPRRQSGAVRARLCGKVSAVRKAAAASKTLFVKMHKTDRHRV